jgi:hypothetical protein
LRGAPGSGLDDLYTLAGEDRVEHAGEVRVPVTDQEFGLRNKVTEGHEQIACLLADSVCTCLSPTPATSTAGWPPDNDGAITTEDLLTAIHDYYFDEDPLAR